MAQTDPDLPLVTRFVEQRSEEAFAELYGRYKDRVYGTAFTLTGDRALADDVTQEVFLRVFRKLETFERRSIFSTWIYRMTVNLATDLQRRVRRTGRLVETAAELARGDAGRVIDPGRASEGLERQDLGGEVARAIRRLSPKLSTVIVLRYLEGLSYEAIGEVLETSVGTVKSRLNRAHAELSNLLRDLRSTYGVDLGAAPAPENESG